ncbi:enteropeptidase-like [Hyalella azteca]|uniref:Enteropeptidase-like n=1 Tax=Hyalella azteca TaxID=294128 RepID=A0A8B7NZC5_HYAAZ|nr:enteropeptidase-like [Hyalella azteca]
MIAVLTVYTHPLTPPSPSYTHPLTPPSPSYIDASYTHDVALLQLHQAVPYTDYVRPVCLPPPHYPITDGRRCTLVGWGQLFEAGKIFPDSLQEVEVPLISTAECQRRTLFMPLYRVTQHMFCAGYLRGGRDACLGDSGGPLMCQEADGRWVLVGVTSNGYGCARPNRPGVYTKVTAYSSWIHQVLSLGGSGSVVPVEAPPCAGLRCALGACVPPDRICDRHPDCSDGSDERNCRHSAAFLENNSTLSGGR